MDDQRQILDAVSAMLSDDFDVVAAATSGTQAVDAARQVRPDVIVLDVEMPGLDGFQTLRAFEQSGLSTTPVVFLSMHDSDEVISEAFRCGGRGYVLKSRVGRDLVNALDQALLGREFVPSLRSLLMRTNGRLHAMHVYNGSESLVDGMAALLDLSLQRGDATCVMAGKDIRDAVGDQLRARGWDVGGSSGHRRYLAVDPSDALNRFMRNGLPDRDRLAEIVLEVHEYCRAVSEGDSARLTLCGNMAVALSEEGNTDGVIAVETLWDELTRGLPFLSLCCYPSSCFHAGSPDLWSDTCARHRALSLATDV